MAKATQPVFLIIALLCIQLVVSIMWKIGDRFYGLARRVSYGLSALVLVAVQLLLFAPKISAAADTCTWTGAVNANWSNGGNWSGCDNDGVPETGDSITFSSSGSNKSTNNDLSITLDHLTIATGATGYSISGNTVVVAANLTIRGEIVFVAGLQFTGHNLSHRLDVLFDGSFILPATVDLNLTGTSSDLLVYSTLPNFPLPVFTGTTNTFGVMSNSPYNTFIMSDDSTLVAPGGVFLQTVTVNCQSNNCLGDSSNPIRIGFGDETIGSKLQLWVDSLTLSYDIALDNGGIAAGEPVIELAETFGTLSGDITVSSDSTLLVATGSVLNITGNISLATGSTLTSSSTGLTGNVWMSGLVSGDGTLAVANNALVMASGNSTAFDGLILIEDGGSFSGLTGAFGTTTGGVIVENGGSLRFSSIGADVEVNDAITVEGPGNDYAPAAIINYGDGVTIAGAVTLTDNTTVANYSNSGSMVFSGRITGTGNLTYTGDDTNNGIILMGSTANDYTGTTTVNNTYLRLDKSDGVISVPGNLNVTGGATHESFAVVNSIEQIADDAVVAINNGTAVGSLLINGAYTESIGTLTGNGWLEMSDAGGTLILGTLDGVFTGHIQSANAPIMKIGTAIWDMQGVNEDGGTGFADFEIAEGTFLANFGDASGQFSNFGITGGTLGGTGTIGSTVVYVGSVSPGNSPGCINPDGNFGLLPDSTLVVEIDGAVACSGYDQVNASGDVSIDNAALTINPSFTPANGAVFTIISGSSLTGQFAGLADGDVITANGLQFRVNYTANSVTLTFISGALVGDLANTGTNAHPFIVASVLLISTGFVVMRLPMTVHKIKIVGSKA